MSAMVELGILPIGTELSIEGRAESRAQVADESHVTYRGELMKFNQWGITVTQWKSINIYKSAQLPSGEALETLRYPSKAKP